MCCLHASTTVARGGGAKGNASLVATSWKPGTWDQPSLPPSQEFRRAKQSAVTNLLVADADT